MAKIAAVKLQPRTNCPAVGDQAGFLAENAGVDSIGAGLLTTEFIRSTLEYQHLERDYYGF
jgi:hypothetical protein